MTAPTEGVVRKSIPEHHPPRPAHSPGLVLMLTTCDISRKPCDTRMAASCRRGYRGGEIQVLSGHDHDPLQITPPKPGVDAADHHVASPTNRGTRTFGRQLSCAIVLVASGLRRTCTHMHSSRREQGWPAAFTAAELWAVECKYCGTHHPTRPPEQPDPPGQCHAPQSNPSQA
jgi:hypothetical protein